MRFILFFSLTIFCNLLHSQNYPYKTIHIYTTEPGSGVDFTSRLIAQSLAEPLGQSIIVDNRATVTSIEVAVKSVPDGHSLLVNGSTVWLSPLVQKTSYDPVKDFIPITTTDRSPSVLVVMPNFPAKSVKDLISLAKANPGKLNYGLASAGGPTQLSAELFKQMASVDINSVPFRGGGPTVIGLLSNQIEIYFAAAPSILSHIKSSKLRGLGVSTLSVSPLFPELPTISSTGLTGYESEALTGIFAPTGTPISVINRINKEISTILNKQELKERFFNTGLIAGGSTSEYFLTVIKSEIVKWGNVLKIAGIHP